MLHASFFSQFLLPPFIACIELVSLGSEASTNHDCGKIVTSFVRDVWAVSNPFYLFYYLWFNACANSVIQALF